MLYSLIPFILLALASALLIFEMNRRTASTIATSANRQENQKSLNKTVVSLTVLFIVMTLPGAVVTSFLYAYLFNSGEIGNLVIIVCDCFSFSFHALNFLILLLTNKRFLREVKAYLSRTITNDPTTRNRTITKAR